MTVRRGSPAVFIADPKSKTDFGLVPLMSDWLKRNPDERVSNAREKSKVV
jgi:hypothetical protein